MYFNIRKKMKGFLNYWLYSQLNKENGLSLYYYLNLIYLTCLCIIILLIPLSFIPLLETLTIVIGLIICLITIPVFCTALSNANLDSFGRKFVFFQIIKSSNGRGRHFASMFDWLIGFFPLVIYIIFIVKH